MSIFVYGVVAAEARPTTPDTDLGPVRLVEVDGLAALCSDVDGSPMGRRRELQAHLDVLNAVFAHSVVVPFRFGMVLADDQQLKDRLLVPHRSELLGELDRLRDKAQFSLRLVANREALLADVVAGDPTLRTMSGRATARTAGRLRLGERAADAYRAAGATVGDAVVSALAHHTDDVRVEDTGGQDAETRAAFLVHQGDTDAFLARADQVAASLRDRFTARLTGPLPAFSFVTPLRSHHDVPGEAQWVS